MLDVKILITKRLYGPQWSIGRTACIETHNISTVYGGILILLFSVAMMSLAEGRTFCKVFVYRWSVSMLGIPPMCDAVAVHLQFHLVYCFTISTWWILEGNLESTNGKKGLAEVLHGKEVELFALLSAFFAVYFLSIQSRAMSMNVVVWSLFGSLQILHNMWL